MSNPLRIRRQLHPSDSRLTKYDGTIVAVPSTAIAQLDHVDVRRRDTSRKLDPSRKAALGQFMTPASTARFMAGMFADVAGRTVRLLDAGAGVGSLTSAFLDRCLTSAPAAVAVGAWEIDPVMHEGLASTLRGYEEAAAAAGMKFDARVYAEDFIESATRALFAGPRRDFTHAILNPPYKKISTTSGHRLLLRGAGIETVNLYTAFVAVALDMLAPDGELVAILPRSFCNGPYYLSFREYLFRRAALRAVHLFARRNRAFKEEGVLQENVIIHLVRSAVQGNVRVTTSSDDTFTDFAEASYPFDTIVKPDDAQRFIHIPSGEAQSAVEISTVANQSLSALGLAVSTGPVVDFRMREHLLKDPGPGSVPLLYPAHFTSARLSWPLRDFKKSNAIQLNDDTARWLYPAGRYVVVRRFSSKEERRRMVASIVEQDDFDSAHVGFENHLNVFHIGRHGLPEAVAYGLAAWLNSTAVDEHFRRFNGHTQVNATDLRQMPYPPIAVLEKLGAWYIKNTAAEQLELDKKVEAIL
ncbi:Eco57I restriction-modification methylase domain-containing protein [Dokdonella sp.]|uniref:Eco57I restriction-modification methylase domain-containing protein n=1 Tax=Dokdonella sp. TaxID=2291710 RepID=UPI003783AE7F